MVSGEGRKEDKELEGPRGGWAYRFSYKGLKDYLNGRGFLEKQEALH